MTDAEREAVILNLVENNPGIGKVKIQKECYFLQEGFGVPLGFEFVMHYYGPYSTELDDTMEELAARGSLRISPYVGTFGYGFDISLGPKVSPPLLSTDLASAIDRVSQLLGSEDAQTAELWATTHFVHSILKGRGAPPNNDKVVAEVKKLKPKFTKDAIAQILDQLRGQGLL